jgi:hypothetical protein
MICETSLSIYVLIYYLIFLHFYIRAVLFFKGRTVCRGCIILKIYFYPG